MTDQQFNDSTNAAVFTMTLIVFVFAAFLGLFGTLWCIAHLVKSM